MIIENLKRIEVDPAVIYGLFSRIWGLGAGQVTGILISMYFSSEIQGSYYTFATIPALQAFVELALGPDIVQFAIHE